MTIQRDREHPAFGSTWCQGCRKYRPDLSFITREHLYCRDCVAAGRDIAHPPPLLHAEPEPATKVCRRCKGAKPLASYAGMTRAKDGKQAWCRECKAAVYGTKKSAREAHPPQWRHKWSAEDDATLVEKWGAASLVERAQLSQALRRTFQGCAGRFAWLTPSEAYYPPVAQDPPAPEPEVALAPEATPEPTVPVWPRRDTAQPEDMSVTLDLSVFRALVSAAIRQPLEFQPWAPTKSRRRRWWLLWLA